MVIGSNERAWSVDVPFDHFGQKHPTGSGQIGQNSHNSSFSRLQLVRPRTFEGHRDLVIGSNERAWSVDVPFDHFGYKHPTGICQIGQK